MNRRQLTGRILIVVLLVVFAGICVSPVSAQTEGALPANKSVQRLLYVASPGIRDYLEYGGHGILVFDIDNHHKFVRRILLDSYGVDEQGKPINVKGVCANAATHRFYVSTIRQLICVDLLTDKVLWQREYPLVVCQH